MQNLFPGRGKNISPGTSAIGQCQAPSFNAGLSVFRKKKAQRETERRREGTFFNMIKAKGREEEEEISQSDEMGGGKESQGVPDNLKDEVGIMKTSH